MKTRTIGSSGLAASAIGYGCMGLSWAYGSGVNAPDEKAGIELLNHALDIGVTLFDTADMYGPFINEELVGKALSGRRSSFIIATKCGIVVHGERTGYDMRRNGTPAHIRAACDASLKRLRTGVIDLYQLHRIDPDVPVEESVGAMSELVADGKVRAIGLSEVDVDTLRRARTVHPIASVQSEYSLFERNVEQAVLPYCVENGIALLAYSPLGRGMLTGRLTQKDIAAGDFRATLPRFTGAAFGRNRAIVGSIEAIATRLGAAPGQVALAWLLAKAPNVIPIPGTKHRRYLEENVAAAQVILSERDVAELDGLPAPVGERYAPVQPVRE